MPLWGSGCRIGKMNCPLGASCSSITTKQAQNDYFRITHLHLDEMNPVLKKRKSVRVRARQDQSRRAAAQLHGLLLKYR